MPDNKNNNKRSNQRNSSMNDNDSDFAVINPSTGAIVRISLFDDESVERMTRELFPNSRQNLFIPTDYHDYDW